MHTVRQTRHTNSSKHTSRDNATTAGAHESCAAAAAAFIIPGGAVSWRSDRSPPPPQAPLPRPPRSPRPPRRPRGQSAALCPTSPHTKHSIDLRRSRPLYTHENSPTIYNNKKTRSAPPRILHDRANGLAQLPEHAFIRRCSAAVGGGQRAQQLSRNTHAQAFVQYKMLNARANSLTMARHPALESTHPAHNRRAHAPSCCGDAPKSRRRSNGSCRLRHQCFGRPHVPRFSGTPTPSPWMATTPLRNGNSTAK